MSSVAQDQPINQIKQVFSKCYSLLKTSKLANKAGYTAISCGRVGRGGNTRFPTFQLERDRPTNQPTDRPTDGQSLL